jgi:hypothetical protein
VPKDQAEREWQRALAQHADQVLRHALSGRWDADDAPLTLVTDQGGPTVVIRGPDGEWRRYYVRLTEVRA